MPRTTSVQVKELADEHGITPAQLALAWVTAKGEEIVPIPARRCRYLEENVAAADAAWDRTRLPV
jgi:aryl-alcohol dehydrogenase-like predicted oxidoreductase